MLQQTNSQRGNHYLFARIGGLDPELTTKALLAEIQANKIPMDVNPLMWLIWESRFGCCYSLLHTACDTRVMKFLNMRSPSEKECDASHFWFRPALSTPLMALAHTILPR